MKPRMMRHMTWQEVAVSDGSSLACRKETLNSDEKKKKKKKKKKRNPLSHLKPLQRETGTDFASSYS